MNPFREALAVLERDGWIQGKGWEGEGPTCLEGALFRVLGLRFGPDCVRLPEELRILLGGVICEQYGCDHYVAPWAFNDSRDITFDDVRLVLEKAAVRWDEQI